MRKSSAALLAACLLSMGLWACQPGDTGPMDESPLPQPAGEPRAAVPDVRPSPTTGTSTPTPTPGPSFTLHTVRRGDTLTSIARRYDTDGRSIAYWNRDQYPSLDPESPDYDPNGLQRGWVLRVLPGEEYEPPPDDGETGESPTPTPADDEYES